MEFVKYVMINIIFKKTSLLLVYLMLLLIFGYK